MTREQSADVLHQHLLQRQRGGSCAAGGYLAQATTRVFVSLCLVSVGAVMCLASGGISFNSNRLETSANQTNVVENASSADGVLPSFRIGIYDLDGTLFMTKGKRQVILEDASQTGEIKYHKYCVGPIYDPADAEFRRRNPQYKHIWDDQSRSGRRGNMHFPVSRARKAVGELKYIMDSEFKIGQRNMGSYNLSSDLILDAPIVDAIVGTLNTFDALVVVTARSHPPTWLAKALNHKFASALGVAKFETSNMFPVWSQAFIDGLNSELEQYKDDVLGTMAQQNNGTMPELSSMPVRKNIAIQATIAKYVKLYPSAEFVFYDDQDENVAAVARFFSGHVKSQQVAPGHMLDAIGKLSLDDRQYFQDFSCHREPPLHTNLVIDALQFPTQVLAVAYNITFTRKLLPSLMPE